MIKMINIKKTNDIDTKTPNSFDYLKGLSEEAKDLMGEIEDENHDIDNNKLIFVGSNKEKFNFNTFNKTDFISAIYIGKTSLKEAEFDQRNLEKINGVLMEANGLLEYRDKIIEAFRDGTFLSKHLQKSDAGAYVYVLKDVNNFLQEIKSMEEKFNLSLFEDLFRFSSPADYAKKLINIRKDKNKAIVAEIKDRISDLKYRKKEMNEAEKKCKNTDQTSEIIKVTLDYNKDAPKIFQHALKVDKGKSKPKNEESIAERIKLKKERLLKLKKKKKT